MATQRLSRSFWPQGPSRWHSCNSKELQTILQRAAAYVLEYQRELGSVVGLEALTRFPHGLNPRLDQRQRRPSTRAVGVGQAHHPRAIGV